MSQSSTGTSVAVGAIVMSADDKRLGMVKEVRPDRFQIDVRWAPDYWLGTETIESASPEQVRLVLTKQGVGPAKLRNEVTGPGLGTDAEDFGGISPANRPPPTL
jgi:hypothetical protein